MRSPLDAGMELTIHGLAELLKKNLNRLEALDPADPDACFRLANGLQRMGQSSLTLGDPISRPILDAATRLGDARSDDPAQDIAWVKARLLMAQLAVTSVLAGDEPAPTASSAAPAVAEGAAKGISDQTLSTAAATPAPSVAPGSSPGPFQSTSGGPAFDSEVLTVYVTEAMEHLEAAESSVLALERDGNVHGRIHQIFRSFHTIKGGAALCGLPDVGTLAHRAESLLMQVRDGVRAFSPEISEATLRSADMLRHLVLASLEQRRDVPEGFEALTHFLNELATRPERGDIRAERRGGAVGEPVGGPGIHVPGETATLIETPSSQPATTTPMVRDSQPVPGLTPVQALNAEAYTRVRTERLDSLVDAVGEFVIAVGMLAQDDAVTCNIHSDLYRKVDLCTRLMRTVQDLSLGMRMIPLKNTFQRMSRLARDTAMSVGKPLRFFTEGDDTEIDRNMVDLFADPLLHMVRNAIDHGIESQEERIRAGKSPEGNLILSARHVGGMVEIRLEDDGRGLDSERIVKTAIKRGLITSAQGLSDDDIHRLIFEPGFSTAEKVTELSGRGVGMDMVKHGIEALKGRIDILTERGQGTAFVVQLPLTMAISDGMLVRVGAERYVVPVLSILLSFRPSSDQLISVAGRGDMVRVRGVTLPVIRLHRLFQVPAACDNPCEGLLVVVQSGERMGALLVDELIGQFQVVVKSLGGGIGPIPGVAGGAILGDGQVGLILDPSGVLHMARQQGSSGARRAA